MNPSAPTQPAPAVAALAAVLPAIQAMDDVAHALIFEPEPDELEHHLIAQPSIEVEVYRHSRVDHATLRLSIEALGLCRVADGDSDIGPVWSFILASNVPAPRRPWPPFLRETLGNARNTANQLSTDLHQAHQLAAQHNRHLATVVQKLHAAAVQLENDVHRLESDCP